MDSRAIRGRLRAAGRTVALVTAAVLGACAGAEGEADGATADAGTASTPGADSFEPGPPLASPPATARQAPQQAPARAVDVDSLGFTRGSDDAPVRVIEFSDFGCGYCRQFHEETWPRIHEEYVESGKIQWKMIPFDVGMFPHAREAVLAGECAGEQGRFEPVRERLFAAQRTWKGSSAEAALRLFRDVAREEGADMERFNRCLAQGWRASRVDAANALARQLGVRGTPTFFVLGVGVIPGALPADEFAALLDRVLATRATEAGS